MLENILMASVVVYLAVTLITFYKFEKLNDQTGHEIPDAAITLLGLLWPIALGCYVCMKLFHELPTKEEHEEAMHNHHYGQKKEYDDDKQ